MIVQHKKKQFSHIMTSNYPEAFVLRCKAPFFHFTCGENNQSPLVKIAFHYRYLRGWRNVLLKYTKYIYELLFRVQKEY